MMNQSKMDNLFALVRKIKAKGVSALTNKQCLELDDDRFSQVRVEGKAKQLDVMLSYREWAEVRKKAKKEQGYYIPAAI